MDPTSGVWKRPRPFDVYLPLFESFRGQAIEEFTFERPGIGIQFIGGVSIRIDTDWVYRDPTGKVIDARADLNSRDYLAVWSLVGKVVADFTFETVPLPAIVMRTLDGYELEVKFGHHPYRLTPILASLRLV